MLHFWLQLTSVLCWLQVSCLAWERQGRYLVTTDGAEAAVW